MQSLNLELPCFGSNEARQTMQNARAATFLLEGPAGIGKVYLSLYQLATKLCLNRQNDEQDGRLKTASEKEVSNKQLYGKIPCGSCRQCKEVFFFSSPHLFFLSLEDRMPFLRFLYLQLLYLLQQTNNAVEKEHNHSHMANEMAFLFLSKVQQRLAWQLKSEVLRLLSLHSNGRIPLYPSTARVREGTVVLKEESLENHLHALHTWVYKFSSHKTADALQKFLQGKDDFAYINGQNFFNYAVALQNSLQRSVYLKESLDKMFLWCKRSVGIKAVVLDELQLVQVAAVGSFLKLLEEPPAGLHFYITTTSSVNLQKEVRLPLLSRLTKLSLKPFNSSQFASLCSWFGLDNFVKESSTEYGSGVKNMLSMVQELHNPIVASIGLQEIATETKKTVDSNENLTKLAEVGAAANAAKWVANNFPMHVLIFQLPVAKKSLGRFLSLQGVGLGNAALFYAKQFLERDDFLLDKFFVEVEELIVFKLDCIVFFEANLKKKEKQIQKEMQKVSIDMPSNEGKTGAVSPLVILEFLPKYIKFGKLDRLSLLFELTSQLRTRLQKRLVNEKNALGQWWLFVRPV